MTNEETIQWLTKRNKNLKSYPTADNPCCMARHNNEIARNELCISALLAQDAKDMNVPANDPCEWCSYFAEEIKSFYVSEYGDDKQHYKFCPMCGRKLPQSPQKG